jgi:hypothetical protein
MYAFPQFPLDQRSLISDARAMIPSNRPSGNPNCSHSRVPIPTWLRLLLFLHRHCRDSH